MVSSALLLTYVLIPGQQIQRARLSEQADAVHTEPARENDGGVCCWTTRSSPESQSASMLSNTPTIALCCL
jgi:hypothetical protein